MVNIPAPPEWRGTSVQVCGLWPFSVGAGTPMIGVPMGNHLSTMGAVCCDPLSWFQRGHLINNPSAFLLGRPGLGKSSTARRWVLGLAARGVHSMILGDLKPDYVDVVSALGGQVISVGPGRGGLNPLDTGDALAVGAKIGGTVGRELIADARMRRLTMLSALIQIVRGRGGVVTDREVTVLERCLEEWDRDHDGPPILSDVVAILDRAPHEVRQATLDRGDIGRYRDRVEDLQASLTALQGNRLGAVFGRHTTVPMKVDRSVVFDVSSLEEASAEVQGAVLMSCWSYGFGGINTAQALTQAGLAPQRNYFLVMDELWRALRTGTGMVDRIDALTRLNRNFGVGQAMITHTMSDLQSMPNEEDKAKARGLVERAGMVLTGGLPRSEMGMLSQVVPLSEAEQSMVVSWSDPPPWSETSGQGQAPGLGRFLIKVGGRPGIPFQLRLSRSEIGLHDTNKKWH